MKKTNKEIRENVFNALAQRGFTVINPQVGNGYYLFDLGEESVVHFHIKGCRRWRWGLWILRDEEKQKINLHLFGEHEDHIDKFKPTQTAIAVESEIADDATEEQWKETIDDVVWDLIYKKLAIVHSSNAGGKIKFYYPGGEGVLKWLLSEWWFYRIKCPRLKWLKYKGNRYVCIILCFLLWLIYGKRLRADYKKTSYFHPAFILSINYKEGVDDDHIFDVYKHIYGNVGFDKSIRIEHIPYGEKRGIAFKIKE